jgi:hypothetical protein
MATNWGSHRLDFLHEEGRGVAADLEVASEREGTAGGGRSTVACGVGAMGFAPLRFFMEKGEKEKRRTTQGRWSMCGGHAPRVLFPEKTTTNRDRVGSISHVGETVRAETWRTRWRWAGRKEKEGGREARSARLGLREEKGRGQREN